VLRIQEVPASSLGPGIVILTQVIRGSPRSLRANDRIVH
jgi:hypothetical protein